MPAIAWPARRRRAGDEVPRARWATTSTPRGNSRRWLTTGDRRQPAPARRRPRRPVPDPPAGPVDADRRDGRRPRRPRRAPARSATGGRRRSRPTSSSRPVGLRRAGARHRAAHRAAAVLDPLPPRRARRPPGVPAPRHRRARVEPAVGGLADRQVPRTPATPRQARARRPTPTTSTATTRPRLPPSTGCASVADAAGLSFTHLALAWAAEHPAVSSRAHRTAHRGPARRPARRQRRRARRRRARRRSTPSSPPASTSTRPTPAGTRPGSRQPGGADPSSRDAGETTPKHCARNAIAVRIAR